ncbi:MAG: GAF domain-containing protein [Burkholderiales bacterium]|nr:GAF domain-containing protein [Burkholderiales bacterium]
MEARVSDDGKSIVGREPYRIIDNMTTRTERRLAAQYAVARVLAEASSLNEAAPRILQAVCENLGWATGEIWLVDRAAQLLRCEDGWHAPSVSAAEFTVASRGRSFARGIGLPGRVWAHGKAMWIEDVRADDNFPRPDRGQAGLNAGLRFSDPDRRRCSRRNGILSFDKRSPDADLLKVFDVIGAEIGQFIERKQSERMLLAIAAGTVSVTDGEFFKSLVRNLAQAIDVRYVFVAECQGERRQRAKSRAFWKGDGFGVNFEYDVAATPCRVVLEGKTAFFPDRLQAQFPEDHDLVDLEAESYFGLPLLDHAMQVIGHLVVLDTRPMQSLPRELSVIQTFAARAGAELERLKAQERQLALLQLNNSIITSLKLSDLLHALREALKRVISHDRAAIAIYEPAIDDLRVYALDGSFSPDQLVVGHLLDVRGRRGNIPFDFQRALLRNDLQNERCYSFDEGLLKAGIRSHCALPLVAGDKTIGILGIGSKSTDQFSQSDFEFLQEVASQIALAIANVQAYEEIEALKNKLSEENVYLRRDLIANVSHDLRTPLAAVRGYLETLLMKGDDLVAETRRNYLQIAVKQSETLGALISELFELAKLDFSGYEIDPEPAQLGDLAQDVVQKFSLAAESKGVTLRADIEEVGLVRADIGLLERAIDNLLDNALKHTGTGGIVTVSVARHEQHVMVRVSDTGSGIPAKDVAHIFERFYKVDKARGTEPAGAGLGLAIVKRICDLHHSEIKVESAPLTGTTFSFGLPLETR